MSDLTELLERAVTEQPPLSITRDASLAAGRRALRRRRHGAAVVLSAAVATLVGGAATLTLGGAGGAPAGTPPAVTMYPVPQLPDAPDVPGAADRPDLVGSDPLLRHFTVDASAWPVGAAVYSSSEGTETLQASALDVTVSRFKEKAEATANAVETLSVQSSASPAVGSHIASPITSRSPVTRTPTTVNGRPATLISGLVQGRYSYWGLLWQPSDGLWVGIHTGTATGPAELWDDVDALHLDRAQRCVVPFQLTDLPAGARLLSCTAGVPGPGDPYAYSEVSVGDAQGNMASVSVGQSVRLELRFTSAPPPQLSNRIVNGHPVVWSEDQPAALLSDDFDGVPLAVTVGGSYDEATATRILAGLRLRDNRADPTTWPTDPAPGSH
jgi:hypothetical protein